MMTPCWFTAATASGIASRMLDDKRVSATVFGPDSWLWLGTSGWLILHTSGFIPQGQSGYYTSSLTSLLGGGKVNLQIRNVRGRKTSSVLSACAGNLESSLPQSAFASH